MNKECYYGCEAESLCENDMCEQCCGDTCKYHTGKMLDYADYLRKPNG